MMRIAYVVRRAFFVVCWVLSLLPSTSEAQQLTAPFSLKVTVRQFDYAHFNRVIASKQSDPLIPNKPQRILINDAEWEVVLKTQPSTGQLYSLFTRLIAGRSPETNITLELHDQAWSKTNYVLMPGAAYNGNRFNWRRIAYSPKLLDPKDIGPDKPAIISDVPRLDIGDGPSRLIDRVGGLSLPAIGIHVPARKQNYWLMTWQGNHLGDYGLEVEENRARSSAILGISSPIVRELYKYRITDSRFPSDDRGRDFFAGDTLSIKARLIIGNAGQATQLQSLFDEYLLIRKLNHPGDQLKATLPMSAAFPIQERKYNAVNWVANPGYYAIGQRENFLMDWQIGWTGGMVLTLPLLYAGADSTIQRVVKNLDWLMNNGISPSGYFYDSGEKGTIWYGGDVRKPTSKNWHLVRKGGDGLYYVLRHLQVMTDRKIPVKQLWLDKTRGVADAFVKTWRKHGQWGQFVDSNTGEVTVGGSTSAGIIPAALVLAYLTYKDTTYLNISKAGAAHLYKTSTQPALTTGGPGDALQNPDSESAYALIESYMALYEVTGDKQYLTWAEEAAAQFATWVCSYNYKFPDKSLFGKTGIRSIGAVLANTQNKHGAPGICTFSGQALLKLTLATGKPVYADILRDISFGMPQYLGHPAKPIEKVKDGYMCERVSMTDWLEGIGEITYQTTWAEASLALSYTELPGLMIDPSSKQYWAFDNVEVIPTQNGKRWTLTLSNPTKAPMVLKVLDKKPMLRTGTFNTFEKINYKLVKLAPGQTTQLSY